MFKEKWNIFVWKVYCFNQSDTNPQLLSKFYVIIIYLKGP